MALQTANQFQLVPDIGGAVSRGINTGIGIRQQQQRNTQFDQAQQDRVTQQEATKQQIMLQGAANAAVKAQNLPDDASRVNFLRQRVQEVTGRGGDPRDTQEVLSLFESNQGDKANALLKSFVDTSVQTGLIKAPATEKVQPFQRGDKGLVFNPNTGEFSVDPVAKQRIDEVANKANIAGSLDFKDRQSLNKDVTSIIKNTVGINNTAKDLSKLGELGTGPASIALVFKFMKALDPTSVVRESEFATAENSAGVPEGVRNMYNKLVSGERLGDKQIKQFVDTAKALSNTATKSSNNEISSLLATFGDTIPEEFKSSLLDRIPKEFKTKGEIPTPKEFTSPGGIKFTVE